MWSSNLVCKALSCCLALSEGVVFLEHLRERLLCWSVPASYQMQNSCLQLCRIQGCLQGLTFASCSNFGCFCQKNAGNFGVQEGIWRCTCKVLGLSTCSVVSSFLHGG
mmetsp:Transcript_96/g.214  ORF Transcript_96/g.214 Transcript_96/m.214 type:complete len:108 (-) Transcript_96:807-1130(-)